MTQNNALLTIFLLELDKGEKYTLNMALKMSADMVIMDEKIGRNIAEYLGLTVIGTLGILLNAKHQDVTVIPNLLLSQAS